MADSEKHPIRNGIIVTVVGGIILAGLLYFIPKLLAFVQNVISTIWNYFLSKTLLPNSILCLLIILAFPTILGFTRHLFRNKAQQTSDEISTELYKTDNFFGMIWKWSYITKGVPSQDLWCYCPNCHTRLVHDDPYDMNSNTIFSCENCNFHSTTFQGTKNHALSRVARQIERKITTGEWKDVVRKSPSN